MKDILIFFGAFIVIVLIGAVIINLWVYPDGKLNPKDFYFENSKSVKIKGYTLHYQQKGEKGQPVLLLPGYGSSTYSYRDNINELAKHFKVYVLDYPPFGLSEKGSQKEYSEEKAIELIKGFIDKVEPKRRMNVIGNSGGGKLAIAVAGRYPKRVSTLVLIDSLGLESQSDQFDFLYGLPIIGKSAFKIRLFLIPGMKTITSNYADPLKLSPGEKEILFQNFKLKGYYNAYLKFTKYPQLDVSNEIGSINAPTLIIWGERDARLSKNFAQKFKARIKGSEVIEVKNAGHVPHAEKPKEVNENIIEFVQLNSVE